jgi:hypothetical protein
MIPVVATGVTILFGLYNGIKRAPAGFIRGNIPGLLLTHESLQSNKKVKKTSCCF